MNNLQVVVDAGHQRTGLTRKNISCNYNAFIVYINSLIKFNT